MNVEARFWAKVVKAEDDACWIWTAAKTKGYGVIRINGKNVYAHRFAYEQANGPIPDNLGALHKCDNPMCVNPNHIFLGTQKDNMQDMWSKSRGNNKKEFGNGKCKLSDAKIAEIRADGRTLSLRQIAKKYGIDRSYASRIRSGERRGTE